MKKIATYFVSLILFASAALAQIPGIPISGLPLGSPLTMQPTDYIPVLRGGYTQRVNPYTVPSSGYLLLSNGTGISLTGLAPVNGDCVVGSGGMWTVGVCGSGTGVIVGSPSTGNLTKFASPSTITNTDLTGDVTTSGSSATTLATVNSNTGSWGSSTAIPSFTVNGKGLITAAATNAVVAPAGTLTGSSLPAGLTGSSLTSTGTLTSGGTGSGFTVSDVSLSTNAKARNVTVVFDGGGNPLTSGKVVYISNIPYSGIITGVTMLSDVSGSAVVDVWKTTYAGAPPTVANTITASDLPTLSSAQKSNDTTLTGWTTTVTAGDTMAFKLNSASTLTFVSLSLQITIN